MMRDIPFFLINFSITKSTKQSKQINSPYLSFIKLFLNQLSLNILGHETWMGAKTEPELISFD